MAALATNVEQFCGELDGWADKLLPEEFSQFFRKLALEALSQIIMRTPVKEGRARGNWQVSIDQIAEEIDTEALDVSGASTLATGAAVLATLTDCIGHVIYISNNVPYILKLEHGSSGQAPVGMVSVTLAELEPVREG
jgi:hypothetical protein